MVVCQAGESVPINALFCGPLRNFGRASYQHTPATVFENAFSDNQIIFRIVVTVYARAMDCGIKVIVSCTKVNPGAIHVHHDGMTQTDYISHRPVPY